MGINKLTELRDEIRCANDDLVINDCSKMPAATQPVTAKVCTGCLRKVRRIYNLYISGCIGDRAPNGVSSESLFKDILFEWESTARGHCTGEREGIFVMSSFTGTREDQYSDEAHFHLDCKVNSQNLRLWSLGKSDVVAEVLFYLVKNKIWYMSNRGVTGPTSSNVTSVTPRPSTTNAVGGCWGNFRGPSRAS